MVALALWVYLEMEGRLLVHGIHFVLIGQLHRVLRSVDVQGVPSKYMVQISLY